MKTTIMGAPIFLSLPPRYAAVRQWECRLHDKIDILHLLISAIRFYSLSSLSLCSFFCCL